jgi:hypothetical protein
MIFSVNLALRPALTRSLFAVVLTTLSAGAAIFAQNVGKPTPIPPATSSRPHASYVEKLSATRTGETVITFPDADVGHPVPKVTAQGVTFELASPPNRSRATPRVMFFPHLMTDRNGILNAMANEQAIPVKITFPTPVSSVTLVMWGSTNCYALVEAHGPDGKLIDSASVPAAPSRLDPADPVPSFELTVKGANIAYVLFGGAGNGEYLAAEEIRFLPLPGAPAATATAP